MGIVPAVLLVVVSAGLTAWLAYLMRRSIAIEVRRRHHEIGTAVFLQIGVIFAVLLAFAFNEVWGGYNNAAGSINGECGNLHGVAILADTLPPAARDPVLADLQAYLHVVIDREWPAMAAGGTVAEASSAFTRLWQSVARLDLEASGDKAAQAQMMSMLASAHAQRETRLFEMGLKVPSLLWGVLVILAVILIAFVVFSGIEYLASQIIFSGVFAGSVVLILVVMRMLDFPFSGVLGLEPTDFRVTLGRVMLLTGGA